MNSPIVESMTEALWTAFAEQVCIDRSLNRICDTGDHYFRMELVARRILIAIGIDPDRYPG